MNATIETIEYLDPTCPRTGGDLVVPAVGTLQGKVIAFLNNGWSSFAKIGERMHGALKERHGISEMRTYAIPSAMPPAAGLLDRVAAECDAAVVGMAN